MSNILQTIFIDYYEHIEYELHPRQTVMENVSKMIHCGDPSYGGAMFCKCQYKNVGFIQNNYVEKPTFLFCIFSLLSSVKCCI